jgi:molecular chaperone Hsp33
MITPMPDATEEEISQVEQAIFKAGAMSKMLDEKLTLKEIAQKITGDENIEIIEENITPIYQCDCSKQHMADSLATIGKEELQDIIETEEKAEIVCHFCNTKYQFSKQELEEIIKNIDNK